MTDRVVMDCYYCGHRSACEIKGQLSKEMSVSDEKFPIVGYKVYPVHPENYEYDDADEENYTVAYRTIQEEMEFEGFDNFYGEKTWRLLQCLTCSQPMLEETIKVFGVRYSSEWESGHPHEVPIIPIMKILYPTEKKGTTPKPARNMPKDVEEMYNEARDVFPYSPRSSAALLRLALQLLCKHLGQSGKDLNSDIHALVKRGLPPETKKALDIIRLQGNNAVHPGEVNFHEDRNKVVLLFKLINHIVYHLITFPYQTNLMYEILPERKRKEIEERDKK